MGRLVVVFVWEASFLDAPLDVVDDDDDGVMGDCLCTGIGIGLSVGILVR